MGKESIGFRPKTAEELRAELCKMTDAELVAHGKWLARAAAPDPAGRVHEAWGVQLNEARAEWRRRHRHSRPN